MKGLIALDIDGTITNVKDRIPEETLSFLARLQRKGWYISFITGRSYCISYGLFDALPEPYFLAVQNGALILEMPSKKPIARHYVSKEVFQKIEPLLDDSPLDFVVSSGFENGDHYLFRPSGFERSMLEELRQKAACQKGEVWRAVTSFDEVERFPLFEIFGDRKTLQAIARSLQNQVETSLVKVDHMPGQHCVLGTRLRVHKGHAVETLKEHLSLKGPVIVAGNDDNDLSMFRVADFGIAMPKSPLKLLDLAHFVAKPIEEGGLLEALEQATCDL